MSSTPDDPFADHAADGDEDRFTRLQESPLWAELMAHEPRVPGADRALGETLGAVAFVVVIGTVLTIGFLGVCAPLAAIPIVMMGGLLAIILRRPKAPDQALPVDRVPAIVGDTRASYAEVDHGRQETTMHLTLELRDGARREVLLLPHLEHAVAKGDFGVAYLRGTTLVDFQRVQSA